MSNNKSVNQTNLPAYIVAELEKIAINSGFADGFTIEQDVGSKHGDGFMATMVSIKLTGRSAATKSVKFEMNFILKMLPDNKARREMFNSEVVFLREVTLYTDILPKIIKFQQQKGLNGANGFFQFPKCHFACSRADVNEHVIIMDDLRAQGYELWDKLKPIPVENVRLLMQALGRFHGLSFAIRAQQPEVFDEFRHLKSLMSTMVSSPVMENMMKAVHGQTIAALGDAESGGEKEFLGRFDWKENLLDCVQNSVDDGPFSVIFHGDCWNNNMMFRNDGGGGAATQVCMLDWQLSQVASPALDLSYFFMSSTTKPLRDQHLDEFLRIYHRALQAIVAACGCAPNELFTYEQLQDELKRYGKYGVIMAPMLLLVIVNTPDNIAEMDSFASDKDENKTMAKFDERSEVRFARRVTDVINDAKAYGWMK